MLFLLAHPSIVDDDFAALAGPAVIRRAEPGVVSEAGVPREIEIAAGDRRIRIVIPNQSLPTHVMPRNQDVSRLDPPPVEHYSIEKTITPLVQEGNTCGPTSLLMVLNSFGIHPPVEDVIRAARCSPLIGTNLNNLAGAAQKFGLKASVVEGASLQNIRDVLESGGVPIVLLNRPGGLHYVVVSGVMVKEDGESLLRIEDPNGFSSEHRFQSFDREWSHLEVLGVKTSLSRCMVVVGKDKILPDSQSLSSQLFSYAHSAFSSFWELLGKTLTLISAVLNQMSQGTAASTLPMVAKKNQY